MTFHNRIINYFSFDKPDGAFLVCRSPVTVNAETAKNLLEKQDSNKYDIPLHVCFDVDSRMIYLPNKYDFDDDKFNELFQSVKLKIVRDFGDYRNCKPIEGSPFSSLRIRSVSSFPNMVSVIKSQLDDGDYDDLPVLEVNFARMPSLLKLLPKKFRENNMVGGYIGSKFSEQISFTDEIDVNGNSRESPVYLWSQKTPFIIINVSHDSNPSGSDKEWVVLSGYRDYIKEKGEDKFYNKIAKYSDLYAIKRHIMQGWPLEEISTYLITETVNNFGELINTIGLLTSVATSLLSDGYHSPFSSSYYYSFKIDRSDFPWDFSDIYDENGKRNDDEFAKQPLIFFICDYDYDTSHILIRSPIFIPVKACEKILNAKSDVFIGSYNKDTNLLEHNDGRLTSFPFRHFNAIRYMAGDEFEVNWEDIMFDDGIKLVYDPLSFKKRKISDYYYASDFIKKLCSDNNVEFLDLDVVIGQIECFLGNGAQGGFMDKVLFLKNNLKYPYEVTKGICISPPVIFINSIEKPSYSEQSEILVHEYRHYIYSLANPFHDAEYNKVRPHKDKEFYKYWKLYLSDANEIAAHKSQIKYALLSGQSMDEIIRDKVGGQITETNYPIAIRFSEIVEEALNELEEESYV